MENKKDDKNMLVLGAAAVFVLLLAIVMALIITHSNTAKPASSITTPQYNVTAPLNNTNASEEPVIAPASPANSSVSALFMTQAQLFSLLGPGASYGIYQRTTQMQLQNVIPPSFAYYNVSGEYNMTYNASTNGISGNVLAEIVFPTNSPAPLYAYMVANYPYFNSTFLTSHGAVVLSSATNVSMGGFVYSASSFLVNSSQASQSQGLPNNPVVFELMIGHKSSSVALISVVMLNNTMGINSTVLAGIASANLK